VLILIAADFRVGRGFLAALILHLLWLKTNFFLKILFHFSA
jgi:hypothetical protein